MLDIVIAYYQHQKYWPRVLRGLEENLPQINNVYVVNDDIWDTIPESGRLGSRLNFLGHPHSGFGLSKSLNQGLRAATAEYVLLCEGDEYLVPNSILESLSYAHPTHLVCCRKNYVSQIDYDEVIEFDHRREYITVHKKLANPWYFCSGGHLLVHRENAISVGFDEEYEYGLHDFDFAVRWLTRFGRGSVVYGGGVIHHIGSGKNRPLPSVSSYRRLGSAISKYHETYRSEDNK